MKRFLARLVNTLPKRIAAAAIVGLAIALPAATFAADTVRIEGSLGVGNVTAGETRYEHSTNASYDQVVKLQVFYHNREAEDSGKIAQNLRVKINIPTTAGKTQVATATIAGDNTNTVNDQVTINLDRADAYLEYIPGSAVWRHNTGTNANVQWTDQKVSDEVVYGNQGIVLENEKPCYNFSANLTVLARVRVPGIQINKYVRVKGSDTWQTTNTAKPSDTLQYAIAYKNMGNTVHNNVVIRDNLPPNMTYVPGSTQLKTDSGLKNVADGVTATGLDVGNYNPGAAAYVYFEVKVPNADKLQCGVTMFRNVGIARPQGMNEYYNTATTNVEKQCQPEQPAYSCDLLDITSGDNRTVTISQFKTTATNGATFKNAVINWGDKSDALTTNNVVGQKHQYAADGTYTISAVAHFTVNGEDKTATSAACSKQVTFTSGKPVTPVTPTELPNTGAGDVAAIFAAATIGGAMAYRVFVSRRLSDQV